MGERTAGYTASIEALFAAYDQVGAGMLEALKSAIAQPAEMKDETYLRTLKARAFDVARYLLPLATNTSLGQIVSARTLENQISRLLASEFAEVRSLGERLKTAAAEPAWNVRPRRGARPAALRLRRSPFPTRRVARAFMRDSQTRCCAK